MTLGIPRGWDGSFDPKLIAKYQRRFPDFDDKVISMHARSIADIVENDQVEDRCSAPR